MILAAVLADSLLPRSESFAPIASVGQPIAVEKFDRLMVAAGFQDFDGYDRGSKGMIEALFGGGRWHWRAWSLTVAPEEAMQRMKRYDGLQGSGQGTPKFIPCEAKYRTWIVAHSRTMRRR